MKTLYYLFFLFFLMINPLAIGQQQTFGKDGFHFNIGVTPIGPEVSLGSVLQNAYGEWFFVYHAIDWETDENLWNKPTSGGWKLGFNYFPMYWGEYSDTRWKWFIGFGSGLLRERLGNNSYASFGDPTEGYWQWWELHSGVRFFITNRFSTTLWVGYAVSIDDSNSMLKKKPQYVTETLHPLDGNLTLLYTF